MLTDVCDLRSVEECTSDAGIMTVKVCGPVRSFVQPLWRDATKVTGFVEHTEPVLLKLSSRQRQNSIWWEITIMSPHTHHLENQD